MSPLKPLIDCDLHARPMGAVHDYLRYVIYGMNETRSRLKLGPDAPYFNAGLICFDWGATIASGLLQRAQAFATKSAHLCKSHDQDALNKAFEGEWLPLDPRWNLMAVAVPDHILRLDYPARLQPYISHFAGAVKPWMNNSPKRFVAHGAWYEELLRDSPWPDFVTVADNASTFGPQTASLRKRISGKLGSLRVVFPRLHRRKRATLNVSGLSLANDDGPPKLECLLEAMIAQARNLP
jgi:lipopolysaccharide biosynthesis glycosyltransferase